MLHHGPTGTEDITVPQTPADGQSPTDRTAPRSIIHSGLATQLVDVDPDESREWRDSLDEIIDSQGQYRARYLMLNLLQRARERGVGVPSLRSTDYINTIPPEAEPWFPGDEYVERRIRAYIRWNAAIMVHRAQRPGVGVGGHISTYASSASLYEVGFNHFFRGKDHPGGGDQIFIQGHASPGIYARAFLEGRLSEGQLDGFRQELSHPGGGLSSYPHPRLMPDFWEFPTVSMGLGALNAVHQARFNKYLHNRGIRDTRQQHVWAFLGDGEMDEPESLGAIGLAAREELDNLTFVISANLQRLDGPVRGNGKVIQELESFFRGAGWNVIKVIWGRNWDPLLAADPSGALVNIMNATPDGDFQTYQAEGGAFIREHFFGRDPRTAKLVENWTDQQIYDLQRGGHDYSKTYAAYRAAIEHRGQPTVILAHTIKGWTLGSHFEARNATHQMKKLTLQDLKDFRDRLHLEIPDSALDEKLPPYFHPGADHEHIQYLQERRRTLGGYLPDRRPSRSSALALPGDETYEVLRRGSGNQSVATTMAFVRLLRELLKDDELGRRIVPIVPDEARTFGMDSFFAQQKIYSPQGQQYISVDRELVLSYKESEVGQILHEGINEAGSTASFIAAGSSYSTHGEPMVPVYIFYSMFGFQRTMDMVWAFGDARGRGFLLGATAGRTTLNGEGLQHEDGHSHLLASAVPNCVTYDPAFAYELATIVQDGLRRMYEKDEDIFYYLSLFNQDYAQPKRPEGIDEGILKGLYRYRRSESKSKTKAQLFGSGPLLLQALRAQEMLGEKWDVAADVWSATSYQQLRHDALEAERWNRLHPTETPRVPYIAQVLQGVEGPIVATSDWMKSVNDMPARWIPNAFLALGTDGYGRSDTRESLRRHFEIDAEHMVVSTLYLLSREGKVKPETVAQAIREYGIDPDRIDPRHA